MIWLFFLKGFGDVGDCGCEEFGERDLVGFRNCREVS